MRKTAWWMPVVLGAALVGDGRAAPPVGGAITGKVSWDGALPKAREWEVDRRGAKFCHCPEKGNLVKRDESLVVDPGTKGVANAVLWLKGVKGGAVIEPAEIDQKDCVFTPHVTLVTTGQKVRVLNPEKICHNFRWTSVANPSGNVTLQNFKVFMDVPVEGSFLKPEFVKVACDIHAWMSGWVAVMENGYAARTDRKGAFRIEGVPPGKYALGLWHEPVSPDGKPFLQEREVVVGEGKAAEAGFTLASP